MSKTLSVILLTKEQADYLVEQTQESVYKLEPRQISQGPHKDLWALPWRVCNDEQYFKFHNTFWGLPETDLALEEAWPEQQEGGFLNKIKSLFYQG